ncbi:MAG: DivIVA domain-containing protein [Ruminococcus flavefaciens]|nr:DivIVA domain-containing protein [Ruminococcus flavefaciens]MCM1229886.1 DivIVA domain-containing protein [Ruminococcus flavefaciens]
MAETKFIRATAFGGYNKADVDKRLDFLYNMVYDLKNELRESKLLLKKYQEGSEAEKNFETVLATERAMITQVQVKNENLSEKNKCIKEEARLKEIENAELRETVKTLQSKLADAELTVNAMKSQNSAETLGVIFVEAQKSRELIISSAKEEAKTCEESTRRFVEEFVTDTNNQASKIIYTAERQAAEIVAEARNQAEQIRVSSNNMKSVMYTEMLGISSKILEIKETISEFGNYTVAKLLNAENIIESADETLKSGGIPVFETAQEIKPDYPEEPVYLKPKPAPAPEKKRAELDKLQAMAEAIGGADSDDLTKQAEAQNSKTNVSDNPAKSTENSGAKKGGLSLADLMKQAQALDS